jgi:hypothetical protein
LRWRYDRVRDNGLSQGRRRAVVKTDIGAGERVGGQRRHTLPHDNRRPEVVVLSGPDAARLAKLLSLLGSSHAGERDSAGLAAERLVRQRGLTWQQVLSPPVVEKPTPKIEPWRRTVDRCLERQGSLRVWEKGFLRDLAGFRKLSVKQRSCLQDIADRVLSDEGG